MADSQLSATFLPSHPAPHPMASPGYGKRSAPDQRPRSGNDFAHLRPRDAAIADHIDRAPDGADISVKTLAKVLPYGQCALRTSLNRLQQAGHLRRGIEHLTGGGGRLWVTRTWFSRTARDDDWWAAFQRGDIPDARPRPTRSRAFILLAALGRENPMMSLSKADCEALAPLAGEWLARGASEADVRRALTAGLPPVVHCPAALARTRLIGKLPPEPAEIRPPLRILECGTCGAPARPEALAGGDCAGCRGEPATAPVRPASPLPAAQVRAHAAEARAAAARAPRADFAEGGGQTG
ncbi:hypothetical protein [Streptomyces sp. PR69]|uniref:hypothetical protein n=1 Tax=Streptomyces sp. PR69 TaxID=2984950 RepID=UPI002263F46D|nr:hypothetical protein [Streptomyces sp. PR69]